MKFLFAILMLFFIGARDNLVLEDVMRDCDIPVEQIEIVLMFNRDGQIAIFETQEDLEDIYDTPIIETIEANDEGDFILPRKAQLWYVGIMQIENLPDELHASFGIIIDWKTNRYWILLFRNNVTVIDVVGDVCGMFEIDTGN